MANNGDLKIAPSGDREIVITRTFPVSRHQVFEALTKPDLIKCWLLGPPGWDMPVCNVDLKKGGVYRYEWHHNSRGSKMGVFGVYRDVQKPDRIVHTEQFDEPWYPGGAVITTTLVEESGKTFFKGVIQYASKTARDGVLSSPMESGVALSYDRLEELLVSKKIK